MNGMGCKTCPVSHNCSAQYRGSQCAAMRDKHGLGDPQTNAECIDAMSVQEKAKFFADTFCHGYGAHQIEEWLQKPATTCR